MSGDNARRGDDAPAGDDAQRGDDALAGDNARSGDDAREGGETFGDVSASKKISSWMDSASKNLSVSESSRLRYSEAHDSESEGEAAIANT